MTRADAEQRQHAVVHGDEVPEQIHEAVLARRDRLAQRLVGAAQEDLLGAGEIERPRMHGGGGE